MQAMNQKLYVAKKNIEHASNNYANKNNYFGALWCPGDDHFVIQGDYFGKYFLGPSKVAAWGCAAVIFLSFRKHLDVFGRHFGAQLGAERLPKSSFLASSRFKICINDVWGGSQKQIEHLIQICLENVSF